MIIPSVIFWSLCIYLGFKVFVKFDKLWTVPHDIGSAGMNGFFSLSCTLAVIFLICFLTVISGLATLFDIYLLIDSARYYGY
jgi:hypothetical protein